MTSGFEKLNQEIADRIRDEYYEPGNTLKKLAGKYNVSIATISNIVTFKIWRG